MKQLVHDGTRCSYKDPYSICVRGECVVSQAAASLASHSALQFYLYHHSEACLKLFLTALFGSQRSTGWPGTHCAGWLQTQRDLPVSAA